MSWDIFCRLFIECFFFYESFIFLILVSERHYHLVFSFFWFGSWSYLSDCFLFLTTHFLVMCCWESCSASVCSAWAEFLCCCKWGTVSNCSYCTNTLTVKRPLTPSHTHFWASVCVFIYLALDTFTFGFSVKLLWNIMYFEKCYTNKQKNTCCLNKNTTFTFRSMHKMTKSIKTFLKHMCHILTNIFFVFMLFSNGFKTIFVPFFDTFFDYFGMKKNLDYSHLL